MPLSDPGRRALRAAVRLNPAAAKLLLSVIRTAPVTMKYKAGDRFGPLGIMVVESGPSFQAPLRLRTFLRPVLPGEFHRDAESFQREWLAKEFTKEELGNEIEACLRECGEGIPDTGGSWRVIRPKQ